MPTPLSLAAGYLCIGALVVVARVLFDCYATLLDSARKLAAKYDISVLRSAFTLVACGAICVAMLIATWPVVTAVLVRKWWQK